MSNTSDVTPFILQQPHAALTKLFPCICTRLTKPQTHQDQNHFPVCGYCITSIILYSVEIN